MGSFWDEVDSILADSLEVNKWKDRSFFSPLVVVPGSEGSVSGVDAEISAEAVNENVLEDQGLRHGDVVEVSFMESWDRNPEVYDGQLMVTEDMSEEMEEVAMIYSDYPVQNWYEEGMVLVDQRPKEMNKGRYNMVLTDSSIELGEDNYENAVEARVDIVKDVANILVEGVELPSDADYQEALRWLEKDPENLEKY